MTVIAVIPYKDGVLAVADSRGTATPMQYTSLEDFERNVNYDDAMQKLKMSDDHGVVILQSGNAFVASVAAKTILGYANLLEHGGLQNSALLRSIKDDLDRKADLLANSKLAEGGTGILFAVKDDDGTISPMLAVMDTGPNVPAGQRVAFGKIKKDTAQYGYSFGPDEYAYTELEALINANCPNPAIRTKEDAMAVALMLENRYIKKPIYRDTQYGKAPLFTVAAPIRMHATESKAETDLTISKDEASITEDMSFAQVKTFLANKLGFKQMETESHQNAQPKETEADQPKLGRLLNPA